MSRSLFGGLAGLALIAQASTAFGFDYCRSVAANKDGYGPLRYLDQQPLKAVSSDKPNDFCIATLSCDQARNGQGYGDPFAFEGRSYKKIDENWSNTSGSNWCLAVKSAPTLDLLEHKGKKIFLTGVNLGNVNFLPFRNNPYSASPEEIKNLLRKAFKDLAESGVNSYRFWLHIDGSRTPSFQSGVDPKLALVTGLPEGTIDDLKWIVQTAYQDYGLLINITLWSHDILGVRREHDVASRDRVLHLFNDDAALQRYIDKALVPLVKAMQEPMPGTDQKYSDGILSWEVFNEPEGASKHWRLYWNYQYAMEYGEYNWRRVSLPYLNDRKRTEFALDSGSQDYTPIRYKGWHFVGTEEKGFNSYMYKDVTDEYPSEWDFLKKAIVDDKTLTTVEIPYERVLLVMNRIAGAIHRLDPEAKISSGAHSMPYNTNQAMPGLGYSNAPFNYYSDSVLINAGGDPLGTMDFYQVHGYPDWSDASRDSVLNMFKHPKSHWNLDKPLIVGEHWSIIGSGGERLSSQNYEHLHDNGYAGVWGWAYFNVREFKDPATGAVKRVVDKHENQDEFRKVFQSLPSRLKYKAP